MTLSSPALTNQCALRYVAANMPSARPLGYSDPLTTHSLMTLSDEGAAPGTASVAAEVPVAFVYNQKSHVVVMCTPADLEDLAVGFSLTEEVIGGAAEVERLDVVRHTRGIELQIEIPAAAAERLGDRSRAMVSRTGCGLCGVEAIDDALRATRQVNAPLTIEREALWRAGAALDAMQPLNRETRAIHAAAWATAEGELRVVREDVGRHNALDKVLGALARSGMRAADGFLVVTSRASYEMIQKAAVSGVALLAAVSRPTDLAIQLAEASGMTLVALLRGRTANVYTHPTRLR